MCRDPPLTGPDGHDEHLGCVCEVAPDGASHHLGHAGITLDRGDVIGVSALDLQAGRGLDERGDGLLLSGDLAQRGQHVADVAEERIVGANDQHARAREALAVGVEQEGRTVQTDSGLARAGRALDAQRLIKIGPHEHVLIGLDGRDDVAHRAAARALDLGLEQRGRLGGAA